MVERIPRGPLSVGTRTQIRTNTFRLAANPQRVCLYFVEYHPEIPDEARSERRGILSSARSKIEEQIGRFFMSGLNIIAPNNRVEPFSVQCNFRNQEYLLNIRNVGILDPSHMESFKMYLNIVLKNSMRELNLRQLTHLPRFYDPASISQVPEFDLSIWKGFSASFGNHIQGVLLNIDFTSKIVRNMTMLALINQLRNEARGNFREYVQQNLEGTICMANYGRNRNYRITSILWNENPTNTFDMKGQGMITFVDYYIKTYNLRIHDLRQPLISSIDRRTGMEFKLIPELMNPTGLTDQMRANFRCMNAVAEYTRLQPHQRYQQTEQLAQRLANDPVVREMNNYFDFHIDQRPIEVNAYRLPLEGVIIGNNQRINIDDRANFNLRGLLCEAVPIECWAVLSSDRDRQHRDRLIKALQSNAQQIGLDMGQALQFDFNPGSLPGILDQLSRPPAGRSSPKITVVMLPPNMKHLYKVVKEVSCRLGLATQVVLVSNVTNQKKFNSVMSKVMVQMASKTGSVPWKTPPVKGIPQKTMVIGIDVHHDNVRRTDSVVGFVASVHPAFTKYYNCIKIQPRQGEEIITNICSSFRESLVAFYEATKRRFMPELIIVYRDGVGDSQVNAVRENEVNAMKKVLGLFDNYNPGFIYVIVNKATSMRLYSTGNRISNPLPGTVVDEVVVPDQNSFYMVSQAVTQGQATPTLYRVIDKDLGGREISTETLALLSLKLCYLYFNWTGGIKIPAPVMMADKLAMIVGQNVHSDYHAQIKLFNWFL